MSVVEAIAAPRVTPIRLGGVRLSSSIVVWFALMAYLVAIKALSFTLVPITFRSTGQQSLFDWTSLAILGSLGLVGVVLAERTGFAAALDARVSNRQRLLLPVGIGVALGVLAIVLDVLTGGTAALARVLGQPSFNADFPGSLLLYSAGGILVDVEYRIFTVPVLLWLISSIAAARPRAGGHLLGAGGISTLFEPVLQGVGLTLMGGGAITPIMLGAYMLTAIPLNFAQVVVFRQYGFLASIVVRQAYYVIWHIAYGNFLYGVVFG